MRKVVQNNSIWFILRKLSVFVIISFLYSCKSALPTSYKKPRLVDKKVSPSTQTLHKRLFNISKNGFAVGHQDDTSYGVGWRHSGDLTQVFSDVYDVIEDYPAVYGFDIGHLELGNENNLDSVPFDTMKDLIIEAHKKGGIITISWHLDNPSSGGTSWDKTPAVKDILKDGIHHGKYELWVSRVADFIKTLNYNNQPIPILFRPFHEMNGAWFWWGEGNCDASDYKKLWRDTVKLLRDKHQLHNLLYVYSPNKLNPEDNYLKYYPGNRYVDILGIDIYDFKNSKDYITSVVHDLGVVKEIAVRKKKLYAFTETGIEKIPTPHWFTRVLYPYIENSGIAWILFWRNDRTEHHYMPYKTHESESDFKEFSTLPKSLFLKDINKINQTAN